MVLEHFGNGHVGGFFDFIVAVDEVPLETRRQPSAYGGLARPHHPHEHDGLAVEQGDQLVFFRLARHDFFPGFMVSVEPFGGFVVKRRIIA
jgi:hypothetical protein